MRKTFLTIILAVVVTVICFGSVSAQDITVAVSIDRDTIGLDEQALLMVEISGPEQSLPAPQMPTLPMFEIYSQGRSSSLSTSTCLRTMSLAISCFALSSTWILATSPWTMAATR